MTDSRLYLATRSSYSPMILALILISSVCYLSILSFLNAQGILRASPQIVGLTELVIYGACAAVLLKSVTRLTISAFLLIAAWLCFMWLYRGEVDPKNFRDLLIPILFLALGQKIAETRTADKLIKWLLFIVIGFGLIEVFFLEWYSTIFNTFLFYVNTGATLEEAAMFEGQMLTLNGFRPEGMGRTILPAVFGQHRASSLLMEPVSLGNFAVLVVAYGLAKESSALRDRAIFVLGGLLLIAIADSRFGLMMVMPLLILRVLPVHLISYVSATLPLIGMFALMGLASIQVGYSDSFTGRLIVSGRALVNMELPMWLGLDPNLPTFGDMGYAYAVSRFGLPLCALLLAAFLLIPTPTRAAQRMRAFVLVYASMILLVSGTSLFALKTAGFMWFMLGVISADRHALGIAARKTIPALSTPRLGGAAPA